MRAAWYAFSFYIEGKVFYIKSDSIDRAECGGKRGISTRKRYILTRQGNRFHTSCEKYTENPTQNRDFFPWQGRNIML
jgi:hypothetical protein